jgi:hypothetical protein
MGLGADGVNGYLTKVFSADSVGAPQSPSIEGLATERWGVVSRSSFSVRFLVLLALLVAAAMLIGADPWGPI